MGIFDFLFGRKSRTKSLSEIPDLWKVATGENNKKPMVVKKNGGCELLVGNKNFSTVCGISFKLLKPNAHGLPDIENEPELDQLEDAIFETFQSDLTAIVPIVISTSGFKEFVIYTKNVGNFTPRFQQLKAQFPNYIMTSYHKPDPNWNVYKSF